MGEGHDYILLEYIHGLKGNIHQDTYLKEKINRTSSLFYNYILTQLTHTIKEHF